MARRTKDDAEKTRDAILDAAEQVFYDRGVSRTSLEQVAAAAGVTRGAVYWHFRNKTELCEAMSQRVFLPQEDVLERLASSASDKPLEDLQKACCQSLELIATDKQRHRVISILMFRCEYTDDMALIMERRMQCKARMLDRCARMFARAKKLKMLAIGWTPQLAAQSLQALMGGLILYGLEGKNGFDLSKSGQASIKAFFRSVKV